jgi:Acetyl-CoA acetyltransferase
MRGRVVISGVGNTRYGQHPGRDKIDLIVEAARNALADANLDKDEIDGVFVKLATSSPGILYGQKVSEALGLRPTIGCALDQGGAANIGLVTYAALAIEAGIIRNALICYGDTARTGTHAAYHRPRGDDAVMGWYSTAAGYAMIHQAYRESYKVPDEHFGIVAVTARNHGVGNPDAHLRQPLSMDEYLKRPFVIEPLRRNDMCLVSDGGAAIILTSSEEAKRKKNARAVPILGLGQAQESWEVHLRPNLLSTRARDSAEMAFRQAGIRREDLSFAQIYDCFTITVLLTLEDYLLAPAGQAGARALSEGLGVDGWLPLNTSGGLLSESGIPGLQLIIEAVRQLRGEARLQVKEPRYGIVSNQGGSMHTHATMILGAAG